MKIQKIDHQVWMTATVFVLALVFAATDTFARGGGGGRAGGGRAGGGFSGGGMAASGSFSRGSFSGGGSFGGGDRMGGMGGGRNQNMSGRQEDRQGYGQQQQQNRQDYGESARNDRQTYGDSVQNNRQDFVNDTYQGNPVYYGAGAAASVVAASSLSNCTMTPAMVGNGTYYQCGSNWYQKAFVNGDMSYVAVAPPQNQF